MNLTLSLADYRLFPYERRLADRELDALRISVVKRAVDHYIIEQLDDESSLRRLTYVAQVGVNGRSFETDIARFEAVHRDRRGRGDGRQATRYHLHGLHEYKGKFNPQVVRAFANLLQFEPGDWLLDPFCGCGTALIEGLSLGGNALGIDASPLAALISRAKVETWRTRDSRRLIRPLQRWLDDSDTAIERAQKSGKRSAAGLAHINAESLCYLESWFSPGALAALSVALEGIEQLRPRSARLLAQLVVSSIVRSVSLQLPEDLRVRRRPSDAVVPPVVPMLRAAVANVLAGLEELSEFPDRPRASALVVEGSASDPKAYHALAGRSSKCVVITSPPYATALPYIDTDRLSLILLGLKSIEDLRPLERSLFGSREWTTTEQATWESRLGEEDQRLPTDVIALCRLVRDTTRADDGFRRKATAGLLYRYFENMRSAFVALRTALSAGEEAVFIVGQNRTRARAETITVDAPVLLGSVAETVGFELRELFALETWPRFGLHHANGIASESAVWLRAA